ncbi:MAG: permease [bacterium]
MNTPWFSFSAQDFSYAFISVLLEGVPFILLGTLLSGLIEQFLPARWMTRLIPRNAFAAVCLGGVLGVVFPMCECGIVPVIRRLIAKGLPVSCAVTYMLAAPIVNPITALSTYAAFRGQGAAEFTTLRVGLGFFIAVLGGLAVLNLPIGAVLKTNVLESLTLSGPGGGDRLSPHSFLGRLIAAMETGVRDFLEVMVYFILGAGVASIFSTAVNQEIFLPLSLDDRLAVPAMMSLAGFLSLCSSSDAFIAATFVAFPAVAKLAFLVFGPMMDLKLAFIYSAVFTRRFVGALAFGLFILTGLLCLRLAVVLV